MGFEVAAFVANRDMAMTNIADNSPLTFEANHRIANNLSNLSAVVRLQRNLIATQARLYTPDDVCALLDDISARIEVVARLQKLIAGGLSTRAILVGDYLRSICEMIGAMSPDARIDFAINQTHIGTVEPQLAQYVGLITAELLTNAIKYAHPTGLPVAIQVSYEMHDARAFWVEVSDDGVGFPENFDPVTDGGLGFQLMRSTANALKAELQFESSALGLRARLFRHSRYLAS
jgi:two-component sensor histidine kinase